jgi:thioredoxin reductase
MNLQLVHREAATYGTQRLGSKSQVEIIIIGAGPYGLSIAAHLQTRGLNFQIFGRVMSSWREQMPAGMHLKSEGFASNLSAPGGYSLKLFCRENGYAYADYGVPVPIEVFAAYGVAFQRALGLKIDERMVASLRQSNGGFSVVLEDGARVFAKKVIVAVGATYFAQMPVNLAHLPPRLASHSADHHDLTQFSGCDVTVVGSGASALDLVALLHDVNARPRLVARAPSLRWNAHIVRRPPWRRWYPMSGLGGGWRNRFYENAPMLFRRLPASARLGIVRTWLGPSGSYSVKERVLASVPLVLNHDVQYAEDRVDRVLLRLVDSEKRQQELLTDHVIAATGYSVRLSVLPFLSEELRSQAQTIDGAPILSADFESSVKGLYFVGLTSASAFGPLMRFVLGVDYTARRLARRMTRDAAGLSGAGAIRKAILGASSD